MYCVFFVTTKGIPLQQTIKKPRLRNTNHWWVIRNQDFYRFLYQLFVMLNGFDDLLLFLDLHNRIKKEGLGKQQITELLEIPNRLIDLKDRVDLFNDHIQDLYAKKVKLEKEIEKKVKMLLTL